jgi:acyl-CoA hydrolase
MEIGLKAFAEDFRSLSRVHIVSAYFTFVALDDHMHPVEICSVIPETEEEIRRYTQAEERRKLRLQKTSS